MFTPFTSHMEEEWRRLRRTTTDKHDNTGGSNGDQIEKATEEDRGLS